MRASNSSHSRSSDRGCENFISVFAVGFDEGGEFFLGKTVGLVEDLQARAVLHAEIGKNFQHFGVLLGMMRIRNVAHLHDQRGFLDFFQRGAERRDQIGRQIAQKSDCVREQRAAARRQAHGANGGIERGEHFRGSQHVGMRQRVEERGFSGVGVADQRNHAQRNSLARARGAWCAAGARFRWLA